MVLGVRLTLAASLLAACAPGAATNQQACPAVESTPAANAAARLDSANLAGRGLTLIDRGGQCMLDSGGAMHALGFAAPCAFLRPAAGAPPWVHDYGDRGAVVLVGGPPAPVEAYALDVGRTPADRCSNTGRAILALGGKLALSEVKTSPLWFCPNSAPDEKYYYGIAHEAAFTARKALD